MLKAVLLPFSISNDPNGINAVIVSLHRLCFFYDLTPFLFTVFLLLFITAKHNLLVREFSL